MGASLTATDGGAAARRPGRAAHRDRLRAAGRERAGEVGRSCSPVSAPPARPRFGEPVPTRDHTELMLAAAGARVARRPGSVTLEPAQSLRLPEVLVPGDISSAAPFLAAAALLPGSRLTVHDVGLNPLRAGFLDVLERMGVRVGILNRRRSRASRSATSRSRAASSSRRRSSAQRCRGSSTSCRSWRCSPRWRTVTTVDHGAPRSCARRSPTGSRRRDAALRAIGARTEERPDGFVDPRRPARACAAARSTPRATTASRCSARSRVSPRARVCASRARSRST